MSRTRKLTLSAMVAALCVACMALSLLIPRVTLAITALAGIFPAVVVITCGCGWAAGASAVAAALGLLILPDKTAPLWFVFFFGHYPIWKALIERLRNRIGKPWLGWVLKLACAALCLSGLWLLFRGIFLAAAPLKNAGTAWVVLLILALAAAFVAYDIACSILIGYFRVKILPRLHQRS